MNGNQGNSSAKVSAMDVTNQQLPTSGSSETPVSGKNPLMTSSSQLARLQDFQTTNQVDLLELANIKACLNTCQIQPGSQLLQAIEALVWKLEVILKEKQDLVMAVNLRDSQLAQAGTPAASTAQSTAYETEEDELQSETDWTKAESKRKKRKRKNSPPKQILPRKIQPPKEQMDNKIKKPPPIKIDTTDVKKITALAKESSGEGNFLVKTLNNKTVKVNCENAEGYRKLVSHLKDKDFSYYTYENKQTRPVRVVAKGLHHQWDEKEIFDDLTAKGFKIESVSKKLSGKDKSPLNMFVLSFAHDENIDNIYKITKIIHNVVEISPLKGGKLVPQCKNCQEFSHTRNHCNKKPRCVKCGKDHITAECQKPEKTPATCANCNGAHPANYRGCTVAKEAQMLRKKQQKALMQSTRATKSTRPVNSNVDQTQNPQVSRTIQQNKVNPSVQKSWAAVATNSHESTSHYSSQDMGNMLNLILIEIQSVKVTVSDLTKRVEAMEKRQNPGRKHKPPS